MRPTVTAAVFTTMTLFAVTASTAQNVVELRGRVVDSTSGQPVAQAIVRVPALSKYTLTNADGLFILQGVPRGINAVVIVNLGYAETSLRLDARPDNFHVLSIAPKPIELAPIVVVSSKFMDTRAEHRVNTMTCASCPPVFWRKWDRDKIIASGIDQPVRFLREAAKVGILKCSSLLQQADRLCVSLPYGGAPHPFYGGNASWQPRQMGMFYTPDFRAPQRPTTTGARVYLDERSLHGLEALDALSMKDIHRVETYGYKGELGIRLYTSGYLRLVEAGLVPRDVWVAPVEAFEFPRMWQDSLPGRRRLPTR